MEEKLEIAHGSSCIVSGLRCAMNPEAICEELKKALGDAPGLVILWQMNRIVWGRWESGQVILWDGSPLDVEIIEELRAFHETAELHLTRVGDVLVGRSVRDGEGESRDYVDSRSQLWGERQEEKLLDGVQIPDDYVRLLDADRKISLVIPVADTTKKYYGLVTRNYIGVNDATAQAGYTDYRYLAVVPIEEG